MLEVAQKPPQLEFYNEIGATWPPTPLSTGIKTGDIKISEKKFY